MDKTEITEQEILASCSTSRWLYRALSSADRRDPVDAANDAELLASLLRRRATAMLARDI